MAVKQYDIIFKGEVVEGVALDNAKKQLSALFNIDAEKVERLFTGKPIALKKGLAFAVANKYRVAIKKAGAVVDVVECKASGETSADHTNEPNKTQAAGSSQKPSVKNQASVEKTVNKPTLTVQAVGASLTDEPSADMPADVDVSHISLREAQGTLVDESEKAQKKAVVVDISALSMGDVGEDVLQPDERMQPVKNNVDVSHLRVADDSEPLQKPREDKTVAPDTAHLKLV